MKVRVFKPLCITAAAAAVATLSVPVPAGTGRPLTGARLSPASLDLDTCSCPTTFDEPVCESRTSWTLEKTTESGPFEDPDGEPFSFEITVTEGETKDFLTGGGQMVITNSGETTPSLASVVVSLEMSHSGGPNPCRAPGPSGNAWTVIGTALESEFADCNNAGYVDTCYGELPACDGIVGDLVLFDCDDHNDIIALTDRVEIPPTQDNDGDGLRDEDPVLADPLPNPNANACDVHDNDGDGAYDEDPTDGLDNDIDGLIDEDGPDDDGDGLVDEDGACEDAVVICFEYEFDVTGLDLSGNGIVGDHIGDLRINLMVTFDSGGWRGGTCKADIDCDDEDESDIRTVQQRHVFDLGEGGCTPVCDCVQLTDTGAVAFDDTCVDVTSNQLDEEICSAGEGTVSNFEIFGTVSCIGENCTTIVSNTAELTCEDPDLIEGSPATASFLVTCGEGGDEPPGPGDFCTQTQGGWGTNCRGNNPGCLRDTYFAAFFPGGLVVGDPDGPDGDASYSIKLTSSAAVEDYLPAGGTPAALTADQTDPETTSSGVFGGQLVAATLNVVFDDNGVGLCTLIGDCDFCCPPGTLRTLIYVNCVAPGLIGASVQQVLDWSNCAISGETLANCGVPAGVTISDLSDALAALNQNFVDCDSAGICLDFP